jgi:uncharacterized membrane protein YedE/YeeE
MTLDEFIYAISEISQDGNADVESAIIFSVVDLDNRCSINQYEVGIEPVRGFIGGLLLLFGARLANGCTSGHGLTGFSNLS